jgi:hypothetical protein
MHEILTETLDFPLSFMKFLFASQPFWHLDLANTLFAKPQQATLTAPHKRCGSASKIEQTGDLTKRRRTRI